MEFGYQRHEWSHEVKQITPENLVHAPTGLSGQYQFTDLFNEGLSGILTEQGTGWYYKHNLGEGRFSPAKLVSPKPSFAGLGGTLNLADLDADGGKQLSGFSGNTAGYFELDDDNEWHPFRPFDTLPNINFSDSNTRMLDLNGDGKPEVLITEDNVFTWYESRGRKGFDKAHRTIKPFDEEAGPAVVFADAKQTIFLSDMSGDGLTDIVRIRNGEVCYWPNLGYGKFGAKVGMDNAPVFDHPDAFNPAYLQLVDLDGSGTTDIVYLGKNKFSCWLNLSGNHFATTPFEINAFPEVHREANITVTDLLGNGVACIVWSSPLSKDTTSPLRYIDLMNSKKPHVMVFYKNNLGKEVRLEYLPSTKYYLADKLAGKPWITKLHFPVQCVSKTETRDRISGFRFATEYSYHHGYYDHSEREFRGFGRVEQRDAEVFDHFVAGNSSNVVEQALHQAPVLTKTWFHTGAFLRKDKILSQFDHEHWYQELERAGFPAVSHPEVPLSDARITTAEGFPANFVNNMDALHWQQALRACKGIALRTETFALDAPENNPSDAERLLEMTPFSVGTHNCVIEMVQPRGQNSHAVFVAKESEAITYNYERDPSDPRIAHHLNLKMDVYGNLLESAAVVYPRRSPDASLPAETQQAQAETHIIFTKNQYTNDVESPDAWRLRLPSEVETFALKGVAKTGDFYAVGDFEHTLSNDPTKAEEIAYHELDAIPAPGIIQRRKIEHIRSTFYRNDLTGPLPLHALESRAIPFENYQLAYTPVLLSHIFGARVNDALMTEGRFAHSEGDSNWWIRSGTTQFIREGETETTAQDRFFTPISYTDPYGSVTQVRYYGIYFLFVEETEDELRNTTLVAQFNFRTLSPQRMRDSNHNFSEVLTDELGLVKALAIFGKGTEADDLNGLSEATEAAERSAVLDFFASPDSETLTIRSNDLLQHATARFVYDFDVYRNTGKPVVVAAIMREEHFQKNNNSPIQLSFEYSNGLGQVVMKKVQAEPGIAKKVTLNPADDSYIVTNENTSALSPPQLRWIGNGRTVLNNKGNAVKQYEPYFSVTHQYEDLKELVETGVTPLLYYDAPGRLVKTEMPDGTFSKTEFDSWKQAVYDQTDTVLESEWYRLRTNRLMDAQLTAALKDPVREKVAADKAALHANTPAVQYFDTLGRPVLSIEHNKNLSSGADEFYPTIIHLDIEGNALAVVDARQKARQIALGSPEPVAVMRYEYDMLGHRVYQHSMDAGQRWLLTNLMGKPLRTWDERGHEFRYSYDPLHRPIESRVLGGDGLTALDHVFEKIVYGEEQTNDQNRNLRGQIYRHYDTGGQLEMPDYDFKGQANSTSRRLFSKYKEVANWIGANLSTDLEVDNFVFQTKTDALGRISRQIAPDGSEIIPSYNAGGLLNAETVTHLSPASTTTYLQDISYNEKGQREWIRYGNNVTTRFYYDRETFRLVRLVSRRQNGNLLQDLRYTYDPSGNITHTEDLAIPTTFFNNFRSDGLSEYTYDALYRLVEATGRENSAAVNFGTCDNWNDRPFMHNMNTDDPMAVRNYTQRYQYDAVGNIMEMKHLAVGGNWTRTYEYEASNNRLKETRIGDNSSPANYAQYQHHATHGYMEELPHLEKIGWNFKEEVVMTTRQRCTDDNIPVTTYYQYDSTGQRIRKITENQAAAGGTPTKKEERIYVAGYEVYKKHTGTHAGLQRTSLSLMDEGHRFVMIDTRNGVDDGTAPHLVRYQLHNHLGSAALELDNSAAATVISYEEFHPFGTTAYQAQNSAVRAAAKRYRYTGMERDEETGLEYHSARYYLPWLGRWLSADPGGLIDGPNVYQYSRNNPNNITDPNGMNPPEDGDPINFSLHLPHVSPLRLSANAQMHNVFSDDRSASGQITLDTSLRTGFSLGIPRLGLNTIGFLDGSASATVDTANGVGQLTLSGGSVLGTPNSGLNLTVLGSGTFQIPVPQQIQLNQARQTFLAALPNSIGSAEMHGDVRYGSFSLAEFSANATYNAGQFEGAFDASTIGDIGQLHLNATGNVNTSTGELSQLSLLGSAKLDLPLLASLSARGTGELNGSGDISLQGSADLQLLGLPSLHAEGAGTANTQGIDFNGFFSGPGPLYTSYISGDFSLSSTSGVSARALILGATYTPGVNLDDPNPPSPGMLAIGGNPREPWTPEGATIGVSFFSFSHGNLSHFSGGLMPELNKNIFTNLRVGFTARAFF